MATLGKTLMRTVPAMSEKMPRHVVELGRHGLRRRRIGPLASPVRHALLHMHIGARNGAWRSCMMNSSPLVDTTSDELAEFVPRKLH